MAERGENMKNVNNIIKEYGMNERLDQIALKDKEYLARDREYEDLLNKCEDVGMNREQMKLVDDVTAAFAAQSSRYAELAYMMGLKDGTSLLHSLKVGNA